MTFPSHIDVAIIGAGAAGLAAARTLEGSNLSSIVLEARDRIGGRAHTMLVGDNSPFDLGCGWLHSADENPFVAIAEKLGFEIERSLPPWRQRSYKEIFPQAERDEFFAALDAFFTRTEAAARRGQSQALRWIAFRS